MAVGLGIGPDNLVYSLGDAIGVVGLVAVFRKKFRHFIRIFYIIAFEVKISVYWTIFLTMVVPDQQYQLLQIGDWRAPFYS